MLRHLWLTGTWYNRLMFTPEKTQNSLESVSRPGDFEAILTGFNSGPGNAALGAKVFFVWGSFCALTSYAFVWT